MKIFRAALVAATLMFVTTTSFADTGVFIKSVKVRDEQGTSITEFSLGDRVNISEENENAYIIKENANTYYADKQDLIVVKKTTKVFKVKMLPSIMHSEPNFNSKVVKELILDETLSLEKIEGEFGLFVTQDQKKGYVVLSSLSEDFIEKDNVSNGTALATKTLKNSNNKYFQISKADILYIKDFKDNQYVILDEEGNEFLINQALVSINKENVQASRADFNRRTVTNVSKVIEYAYNAIGKPYVSADIGKKGYDCSGLTYSAFLKIGVKLPRTSSAQAGVGTTVKKEDLIPGDLIFFNTSGKGISHVGLYIGDGNMIHASTGSKKVKIDEINSTYYKNRFVIAKRIIGN